MRSEDADGEEATETETTDAREETRTGIFVEDPSRRGPKYVFYAGEDRCVSQRRAVRLSLWHAVRLS